MPRRPMWMRWSLATCCACAAPASTVDDTDLPVYTDVTDTDAPDTDTDPDVPDTDAPDTDVPDTDAPDTDLPDTDVPDTDTPDTDPDTDVPDTDVPDTDDTDLDHTDTGAFDLCAWLTANPEPAASTVARIEVACPVPASQSCTFAPVVLTTYARYDRAFALQAAHPGPITCSEFQGTCIGILGTGLRGVTCTGP